MKITLDPASAAGVFVLNAGHQVVDGDTMKVVDTVSVAGTRWPCFGSTVVNGIKHWLVQPPDIGHLCFEGDAGGTFVPTVLEPDPAALAAARSAGVADGVASKEADIKTRLGLK